MEIIIGLIVGVSIGSLILLFILLCNPMEKATCPECLKEKPKEEVYVRECAYSREVNNEKVEELICDDCEQEHIWDI